jgi:hypothetical protein
VKPERALVPLLAVVLAVFGTSRVMESVDPGAPRASASSDSDSGSGGGGDHGDRKKERGDHEKSHETHSFFSPAGMRDLAGLIRREAGPEGRVSLFRVQAHDAQVFVKKGSGGSMLVIERGPKVKFSGSSPAAPLGGFSLSALDPRAPERIGDAIARLSSSTIADVDYMVFLINPVTHEGSWEAFLTNGDHTHFHADAHGRHVTRP